MSLDIHKEHRMFGGRMLFVSHASPALGCDMNLSVFLPPDRPGGPRGVLYWLSGLTCTEENFTVKAGAQRMAAKLGLVLVAPDTSPRGLDLPGEDEHWFLGTGAGFYLDAIRAPWSSGYRMETYITKELPALVEPHFGLPADRRSVLGHSMGGHGALTLSLRHPGFYRSVSAFAPICAPMDCPWGHTAFSNYLGEDRALWAEHDTCRLLEKARDPLPMLVDQGTADGFLDEQLKPHLLERVCAEKGWSLELRRQEGYDHSYFFIASFIDDHLEWHARALAT